MGSQWNNNALKETWVKLPNTLYHCPPIIMWRMTCHTCFTTLTFLILYFLVGLLLWNVHIQLWYSFENVISRTWTAIFLTLFLIGSINDTLFLLTNQQIVLIDMYSNLFQKFVSADKHFMFWIFDVLIIYDSEHCHGNVAHWMSDLKCHVFNYYSHLL